MTKNTSSRTRTWTFSDLKTMSSVLLMSHPRHVHYFRREYSIIRPSEANGSEACHRTQFELCERPTMVLYSFLLVTLGRADEALAEMHAAREIDPLSRPILVNSLALRIFRRDYSET